MKALLPWLTILVWTPALAAAQTSSPDRDVTLEHDALGFHSKSVFEDNAGEDWVGIDFDLAAAQIALRGVSTRTPQDSDVSLETRFVSLWEFSDTDADGRYSPGEPIVQRFGLPGSARASLSVEANPVGDYDAVARYPLNATGTTLPGQSPQEPALELRTAVRRATTQVGGLRIEPDEAFLQITIHAFPLQRADTRLALELLVGSGPGGNATVDGIAATDGLTQAMLRWDDMATGGLGAQPVGTTVIQGAAAGSPSPRTSVVFSYAAGDEVVHESTIGFDTLAARTIDLPLDAAPGRWGWYLAAFLGGATLIGLSLRSRLRGGA